MSRVVAIGLDACDPAIAQRMARAGEMPTLRRLLERAARCRVRNPYGLFVGALWMSFATGLRPDRHHFHCWDEIDIDSYVRRLTSPPNGASTMFWQPLSDAGRRVAVIDVPHSRANVPLDGIQVVEWGCHDRHFGFHTWPPKEARNIEAAFGLHPVLGMDPYAVREFAPDDYAHRTGSLRTPEENRILFDGLMQGVRAKRKLNTALMAEGNFDLFGAVFGESHAIGHQQWHLHDAAHPRHDPAVRDALGGDPLPQIYRELDGALGDMLALTDEDTTVLVLLSHGMGPHHDGTHLLDEVLSRIDRCYREPPAAEAHALMKRAVRAMPGRLQQRITAFATPAIRARIAGHMPPPCAEYAEPAQRARQAFFVEPNNYVYGGVRLNLAGREPNGAVAPREVDAVCRRLTGDLLALVNVDTGGPVIRDVIRADRWYRRSADDHMPDLFIDWERRAPIETVWSARIGLVHSPYTHWRTGDHRPDGLLLAYGSGIPARSTLAPIDLEDIAPGIAARLGVALPDVDGSTPKWLG